MRARLVPRQRGARSDAATGGGRGRGCSWRAQARSPPLRVVAGARALPPLRHSVGRRDTLPLSSMARRRPATGDRGWGCGLRARGVSAPRAPPLCGPAAAGCRSRRCGAARPLLPLRDAATTSGWGGPARSRPGGAGEGGSVGMPRHAAGRSWPDRRPGFFSMTWHADVAPFGARIVV